MICINVIASGSKGNCTVVNCDGIKILLDVGIGFGSLQRALNFENPLAALVTHEHGDHANKTSIRELLKRGVKIYMSEGTAQALELEPRHNLECFTTNIGSFIGDSGFMTFNYAAKHDAAEPVNFVIDNGIAAQVAYIIDTGEVPEFGSYNLPPYLIIEANHSRESLLAADIDAHQKQRILSNHLSIEKAVEYICNSGKDSLKEVHLVHISKRHGNAELFRQMVQAVVGDKVKVFAY